MAKSRSGTEFTARWLDRVQPPENGRDEYWDTVIHGLGLRVSSTGHKAWFVLFRAKSGDSAKRITLGSYPVMSLLDAREAARAKMVEEKAAASDDRRDLTVEDLVDEYLDKCASQQLRESSLKRTSQILRSDVVPQLGDRRAIDVKRRDVIAWVEAIKERGAPVQANRALACLRRVYNWAISQDRLEVNPCNQVKAPAQETPRDRVLSAGEIRALWRSLDGEEPAIAALFRLHLLTAQRGGEVRLMRWEDVDLQGAVWTIPAARSKNGMSHRVPLSSPAVVILRNLGGETGPVIPGLDPELPMANPYKAVQRARKRSGVAFVPHDLRRTAASYMAQLGLSEDAIGKVLNHAAATVTSRHYIRHGYDLEKKQALDLWAERLMGIVG
jgi:integrase